MKQDTKQEDEGTLVSAAPGFAVLMPDEENNRLLSWPVIAWRIREKGKSIGAVTVDGGCAWLDFAFQKTNDDTGLRQPDGSVLAKAAHMDSDEMYWEWVTDRPLRGLSSEELREMGFAASPR